MMRYPPVERHMREKHPGTPNGRGDKNTDLLAYPEMEALGKKWKNDGMHSRIRPSMLTIQQ
jgi:hypothetical protein